MGYIKHQAIIATAYSRMTTQPVTRELVLETLAADLQGRFPGTLDAFSDLVMGPAPALVNGYVTWVMAPDGSEEGWATSDAGDVAREVFVNVLQGLYQAVDIVEVTFGGDHGTEQPPAVRVLERGHDPVIRSVRIPARADHGGFAGMLVDLVWVCPRCGGPRGLPHSGLSFDGSLRLTVDVWTNPCGHVDDYASVRAEAADRHEYLKSLRG